MRGLHALFDLNAFESPQAFLRSEVWVATQLENPLIRSLAQAVCGPGHQLYEVGARTVPPISPEDGAQRGGYVRWRRDSPLIKGGICKVFVYLNDVGVDGGCTALVPGPHRWALSPGTTFPVSDEGDPPAGGEICQIHAFGRARAAHVGSHAAQDAAGTREDCLSRGFHARVRYVVRYDAARHVVPSVVIWI